MSKQVVCPFCNSQADYQMVTNHHGLYVFDCNEVCGTYFLSYTAEKKLKELDLPQKISMVSESIRACEQGLRTYWFSASSDGDLKLGDDVTSKCIHNYKSNSVLYSDKLSGILTAIANKVIGRDPFSEVILEKREYMKLKIIDRTELFNWMTVLRDSELLESDYAIQTGRVMQKANIIESDDIPHSLTARGWQEVERLNQSSNSNKAFIAMKFSDNPERTDIQSAIEGACAETGWEATTIDKEEFVGGISDEIIAKINQSRFVVADFTGQNHGVYYEAGYASGLGIPVIYTVKTSDISNLHFDTKHINHIAWSDFDDLKMKLKNRIEAVINTRLNN